MIQIRNASMSDAKDILKIYEYYVLNTAITFDIKVPSIKEFEDKIINISKDYPFLVLLDDGIIKGFAYSHAFYGKEAYKYSNELTIYIDHNSLKKGYGKMLYDKLEEILKENGILNLYACISMPNGINKYLDNNSIDFHTRMGYKLVGTFNDCGYKFNKFYSVVWMEKIIGKHNKKVD